jgi:hypothetical protein
MPMFFCCICRLILRTWPRDGRRVSVADTRQGVWIWLRMTVFPPKPGGYRGIPRDTWGQGTCTLPAGRRV